MHWPHSTVAFHMHTPLKSPTPLHVYQTDIHIHTHTIYLCSQQTHSIKLVVEQDRTTQRSWKVSLSLQTQSAQSNNWTVGPRTYVHINCIPIVRAIVKVHRKVGLGNQMHGNQPQAFQLTVRYTPVADGIANYVEINRCWYATTTVVQRHIKQHVANK